MEEGLQLNSKLFGLDGVIGRRDYIINLFIITLISQLITTPLFFGRLHSLDFSIPIINLFTPLQKIMLLISLLICLPLNISNIVRRLSDIWSKKADPTIYSITIVYILLSTSLMFFPLKHIGIPYLLLLAVSLFLMIKKGEVTGKYPVDPIKKFNWGAFFGTWIWGLFNKTFITLWEIPLWFTHGGILTFPLICGLKGNEWAYKNKQYTDVESFHKSQKKQALVFTIIMIVGSMLLTFVFAAVSVKLMAAYLSKKENRVKVEHTLNDYIDKSARQYFVKIETTAKENKLYMNPVKWTNLDYKEKMDVYKLAYTYAGMQREKSDEKINKANEMERTVIYSEYNNEVLAKFSPGPYNKNAGFIKSMQQAMKSFYFNDNPKLP